VATCTGQSATFNNDVKERNKARPRVFGEYISACDKDGQYSRHDECVENAGKSM